MPEATPSTRIYSSDLTCPHIMRCMVGGIFVIGGKLLKRTAIARFSSPRFPRGTPFFLLLLAENEGGKIETLAQQKNLMMFSFRRWRWNHLKSSRCSIGIFFSWFYRKISASLSLSVFFFFLDLQLLWFWSLLVCLFVLLIWGGGDFFLVERVDGFLFVATLLDGCCGCYF